MAMVFVSAWLLLTGCDTAVDVPHNASDARTPGFEIGPIGNGPQAAAVNLPSAVSVAPDGRLYGCVLSAPPEGDTSGPYQYRYAQLAFPEAVAEKALGEQRLTYRLRTEDGLVLRQATCLTPATAEARDLVLDWVGRPDAGDGWSSGSSTDDDPKNPMPILHDDPVECHNEPLEDMDCSIDEVYLSEEAIDDGGAGDGGGWDPTWPEDDWLPDAPWGDDDGIGGGPAEGDDTDEEESECGGSTGGGSSGGGSNSPPPTGGDDPCGADCYDPPTDDSTNDSPDGGGSGNDSPHDAPGFMVGATWHVVTSSGLIAAPYDPDGHTLLNEGCDPEPPCESDNPPEHCDEAGSCFDAEIEDEEAAAIFRDLEAASVLGNLRDNSNFDAPLQSARLEQGGWIVETADGYGLEPFPSNWVRTACAILPVTPPGGVSIPENAVGMIHTHPFEGGESLEECGPVYTTPNGVNLYDTYDNTPSDDDIATIQSLQNAGYDIDGYVIDKDKVIAYDGATLLGPGSPNPPVKIDRCGY